MPLQGLPPLEIVHSGTCSPAIPSRDIIIQVFFIDWLKKVVMVLAGKFKLREAFKNYLAKGVPPPPTPLTESH